MPVHNRAWCVAEAIDSVMAITTHQIELLVIDDGSTDDTPRVLAEAKSRHGSRIVLLQHPGGNNRGIAASRNLGLAAARAPFVAFLDSDDLFLPNRFDEALSWMQTHPEILAGLEPYELEDHGQLTLEKHLTEFGTDARGKVDALDAMLTKNMHWTVPVVTVRREAFELLGLFDPKFSVGEDTALWLRFAAAQSVGVISSDRPVARVRRHQQHSWTSLDAERAWLVFFDALLDAIGWARRHPKLVDRDALEALRRRLRRYLVETLCRPDLRSRSPVRAWWQAVQKSPGLVLDRAVLGNLRSMLGRKQAA